MNLSCGASGLSAKAAAGQAPTQDRHSVQVSVLSLSVPNGLPLAGRAMTSVAGALAGACWRRCSSAISRLPRLSADTAKLARLAGPWAAVTRSAASSVAEAWPVPASTSRKWVPA